MRTAKEIREEIDKVHLARKNSLKKIKRCNFRIEELYRELKSAEAAESEDK